MLAGYPGVLPQPEVLPERIQPLSPRDAPAAGRLQAPTCLIMLSARLMMFFPQPNLRRDGASNRDRRE